MASDDIVAPAREAAEPRAVITGRDVSLHRPDPIGDTPPLFAATHGSAAVEATWDYMGYGPFVDESAMAAWIAGTVGSRDPFWWTVTAGGVAVGMAAVLNRDSSHRRAEVGHIWYVPAVRRTTVNTEAAYLMIRECFEGLQCRRVEWKCDARNEVSRTAALRLGFVFEGVFRHHMIVKGRNRDTAWFAMTESDWAAARPRLEHWLYEAPRDAAGRPLGSLHAGGVR